MWYIPMIIGIYLGIPLIAKIVKDFSYNSILIIMIVIFLYYFVIPGLNIYFNVFGVKEYYNITINIPFMGAEYGLYLLAGYYIYKYQNIKINKIIVALIGIVCFLLTVYIQIYSLNNIATNVYRVWYNFPLLFICSICSFILLNRIEYDGLNGKIKSLCTYISKYSLGIFYIHSIISEIIVSYIKNISIKLSLIMLIVFVLTFVISFVCVHLLSKSKVISKRLFLIK